MKRPRRWIAQEIDALDPEVDYERIWRLTSTYGLNEFALNLVYAHLFPHFYIAEHGAEPLWDHGAGKVVERATQRVEDTIRNNLIWWYYGPGHPKTRKSVEAINKLHAFHAQRHPGRFAHQEDYVYTLAFSAASLHRFNLKLGLPGYTDKQKVAAHRFWQAMAGLFIDENGKRIVDFPSDWNSMIEFLDEFERRAWPPNPTGELVTHAILDQFAHRFFPRSLHGLARALVIATYHPTCWRVHNMRVPPKVVRVVLLRVTGWGLRLQRALLSDPVSSYQERLEAMDKSQRHERHRAIRELDSDFAEFFRRRHRLGIPAKRAGDAVPREAPFGG